jgi:hypothetical protein
MYQISYGGGVAQNALGLTYWAKQCKRIAAESKY